MLSSDLEKKKKKKEFCKKNGMNANPQRIVAPLVPERSGEMSREDGEARKAWFCVSKMRQNKFLFLNYLYYI